MQYYCLACLKTDCNVRLMTSEEVHFFGDVICKNTAWSGNSMYICAMCRCILRRLIKFIKQCLSTQKILRESISQDIRYNHLSPVLSLGSTAPDAFYVGPDQVTTKQEKIDGFGSDEDNVPLVMLGKDGDTYDDGPGDDGGADKLPELKSERAPELNGHKRKREKKRSRKKKELREGFTSRMVQETDEYLVIKLSKEQVLQEMAENAKSARYVAAPYKCGKCVKGFNFEDVLETHMAKHSPDIGKFQCELCSQYCASAVSLRGHMKSHTTRYKCKVCGIVRLSRQHVLEHHGISHTAAATAYTCDKCGFTTNKRTVIQNHVRTHNAREPHACHLCGKLYKNLETLRIHIMRHDKKRHVCAQCAVQFAYAAQLAKHVRAVHERRDFYCVECDLLFKSSDTLKIHFQRAKRHRDASSYKHACPECPQRFISQSALRTHLTAGHGAPPPCRTCGGLLSRKDLLALHTHTQTHTGERPNVCACDASVDRPASVCVRAQKCQKTTRRKNSEEEKGQEESITTLKRKNE